MKAILTLLLTAILYFPNAQEFKVFLEFEPGTESAEGGDSDFKLNGLQFFEAGTALTGPELWVTDGTAEGTREFIELVPGMEGAKIGGIRILGSKVIFSAEHPDYGRELWVTDGTLEGTFLLKDIYEGPEGSDAYPGIVYNDKLYFVANTPENYRELWVTDGTTEGTEFFKIVCPNCTNISNSVGNFVAFKDHFLFKGEFDMWMSDGTPEGTEILFYNSSWGDDAWNGSNGLLFTDDSLVYFSHYLDGLYKSTGELGSIISIDPDSRDAYDKQMFDGKLYYLADVMNGFGWRFQLKSYDPATGEVVTLTEEEEYSRSLFQFDGRLYFRDEQKLYCTSGSPDDIVVEYENKSYEHLSPHISDTYLITEEFSTTHIKKKGEPMIQVDGVMRESFLYNDVLYGWEYTQETGTELYYLDLNALTFSSEVVEWQKAQTLTSYPNPTSGKIMFNETYESLEIIDLAGSVKAVAKGSLNSYDISHLNSGLYIIRAVRDGLTYVQKIKKD